MVDWLKSLYRIYALSRPAARFRWGGSPLPVLLQVQTVSACNGRCAFCPYPQVSRTLPQGRMDWELYQKIVDECLTFPSLRLFTPMLQNEPLLDGDIGKAVRCFKERAGGRVPVYIVSNGYLLNRELIRELAGSGLDHLIISLNAVRAETYAELMPGFAFERLLANIEELLSSELGSMKVTLRFLENRKNSAEIRQALAYWKARGVRTEVLSFISNRADSVDIDELKPRASQLLPGSRIKQKAFTLFSSCCILPFYQMSILFNGDVLLCCNDWQRNPVLGNVRKENLRDIWNGERARNIKTQILGRRYGSVRACSGCSVPEYFRSW